MLPRCVSVVSVYSCFVDLYCCDVGCVSVVVVVCLQCIEIVGVHVVLVCML